MISRSNNDKFTRSHSELGSQVFLRRWYFVLRHGRVGHCQAKSYGKIFVILFCAGSMKNKSKNKKVRLKSIKKKSSLKSIKKRDLNSKLVRRRGRVYVINKTNPKFKARQK